MERFKKVLNPLVILLGVIIILIVKLEQSKQEIMKLEEREMVIIHKVDNAGVAVGERGGGMIDFLKCKFGLHKLVPLDLGDMNYKDEMHGWERGKRMIEDKKYPQFRWVALEELE